MLCFAGGERHSNDKCSGVRGVEGGGHCGGGGGNRNLTRTLMVRYIALPSPRLHCALHPRNTSLLDASTLVVPPPLQCITAQTLHDVEVHIMREAILSGWIFS